MSAYKHPYKQVRCRYFDDYGRPLSPACNQGERCRFTHPGDPNWPGAKFGKNDKSVDSDKSLNGHRSGSRRTDNAEFKIKPSAKLDTTCSPKNRTACHSTPLVSQADLFLRCKVEADIDEPLHDGGHRHRDRKGSHRGQRDWDRGHGYNYDYNHSRVMNTNGSRIHEDRSYLGVKRPEGRSRSDRSEQTNSNVSRRGHAPKDENLQSHGANSGLEQECKVQSPVISGNLPEAAADNEDDFSSAAAANRKHYIASKVREVPGNLDAPVAFHPVNENERVKRVVELFRGLARLSNKTVQDIAVQDKEEKKLQTYTEISSSLSKISSSASSTIAPALGDIYLNHAQCKRRVEENFKALGNLWEQVFDVFVTEIVHAIDSGLEDALVKLKSEGEYVVGEVLANSTGALKRKLGGVSIAGSSSPSSMDDRRNSEAARSFTDKEETRSKHAGRDSKDCKRRRLAPSSSRERALREKDYRSMVGSDIDVDSSIEDILEKMKKKIDYQAHSLQTLTKENNALKTTLQTQLSTPSLAPSRNSFPTISIPHDPGASGSDNSTSKNVNIMSDRASTWPSLSPAQLDYFRSSLRDDHQLDGSLEDRRSAAAGERGPRSLGQGQYTV